MTVSLWLTAIWWGLAYRTSQYGVEVWEPVTSSVEPAWTCYIGEWNKEWLLTHSVNSAVSVTGETVLT